VSRGDCLTEIDKELRAAIASHDWGATLDLTGQEIDDIHEMWPETATDPGEHSPPSDSLITASTQ
jgi:hypothetical protein